MRIKTALLIALHFALAGILYAATSTEPTNLPGEDTLVKRANYPDQNCQIDFYKTRADIALNGRTYILVGTTESDQFGAVSLLESPTGNAVVILPEGSADFYLEGVRYTFERE